MSSIFKIYNLLNTDNKKYLIILISLSFIAMGLELLGIGSVIPLIYLIISSENNIYIDYISNILGSPEKNVLILIFLLGILSIFLFKSLYAILLSWLQARFGMLVQVDFAKRLLNFYLTANYEFHLQKNSSELLNNIDRQINQCVNAVKITIILITEIIIICGIFALLLYINFFSTLLLICIGVAASGLYYFFFRKKLKKAGEDLINYEGQKLKNILEGFQGIKEIKIYNKVSIFLQRFLLNNNSSEKIKRNVVFLQSLAKQFYEMLSIILFVSISISIIIISSEPYELLMVVSVYAVAGVRLMPSANKILSSLQEIRFAFKGVDIIHKEFELEKNQNLNKVNFNGETTEKPIFDKTIMLNNLSFSYKNSDDRVLNNINFVINKGEVVKVNGESGKGKSTLVHLLIGLLKPSEGNITVDGRDVEEFTQSWRSIIGYVPQSIYLLDDTIKKNIAFGIDDKTISDNRLKEVVSAAKLDDFISTLPNGINTYVGELGSRISGGQLQRIGIARALYNKPQIIVFDEATNSLDPENEDKIINLIKSYTDITIIFISHNRELLKESNKVLNL